MRVLVVEDDLEAQRYLVKGLKEAGHVVDEAGEGETGLTLALSRPYDVAIVDRMLPKLDGLRLVGKMREERNNTPVLFLSALSDVDDRIKGLRAGGDDYLTKPYAFAELLARLDALVRRRDPGSVKTRVSVGDLELDLLSRTAKRNGSAIELQPREFRLLEYLMRHADRLSRAPCCWRMSGNITSTPRPMSSMFISPVCAPRSTKDSKRRCSTPFVARDI